MPVIEGHGRGFRSSIATYNFAAQGGAIGSIVLAGDSAIPAGATIVGGYLDVVTPPTSGGAATIAIQVEGAGDVVAAAAVAGAPWSTTGRKSVVPAFTGATSVRTTAVRQVTAVVATAVLTAGAFNVVVFWQAP